MLSLLLLIIVRTTSGTSGLIGEEIPCPAVGGLVGIRACAGRICGDVFGERVGSGGGGGTAEEFALAVVFPSSGVVGEGEVGVVYELEFSGAGCAFRGVGGDSIWVGFEGGAGDC